MQTSAATPTRPKSDPACAAAVNPRANALNILRANMDKINGGLLPQDDDRLFKKYANKNSTCGPVSIVNMEQILRLRNRRPLMTRKEMVERTIKIYKQVLSQAVSENQGMEPRTAPAQVRKFRDRVKIKFNMASATLPLANDTGEMQTTPDLHAWFMNALDRGAVIWVNVGRYSGDAHGTFEPSSGSHAALMMRRPGDPDLIDVVDPGYPGYEFTGTIERFEDRTSGVVVPRFKGSHAVGAFFNQGLDLRIRSFVAVFDDLPK